MKVYFKPILLSLIIISLSACFDSNKTNSNIEHEETTAILNGSETNESLPNENKEKKDVICNYDEIKINPISEWPDEIGGCTCTYSFDRDKWKTVILSMDDNPGVAYMNINGNLTRLTTDQIPDQDDYGWGNECLIASQQCKTIEKERRPADLPVGSEDGDEVWEQKCTLTLKMKNHQTILKRQLYADCGC